MTIDQLDRRLRNANPVDEGHRLVEEVDPDLLLLTIKRRTDMSTTRVRFEPIQKPAQRPPGWRAAIVAFALILGVALIGALAFRGESSDPSTTVEPTITPTEARAVVDEFYAAVTAGDVDAAFALLDPVVTEEPTRVGPFWGADIDEARDVFVWETAMQSRYVISDCSDEQWTPLVNGVRVPQDALLLRCDGLYSSAYWDLIGEGPLIIAPVVAVSGSGTIVEMASISFRHFTDEHEVELRSWIRTHYPEDEAALFTDGGTLRRTAEAAAILLSHAPEFAESLQAPGVSRAIEALEGLLADVNGGAWAEAGSRFSKRASTTSTRITADGQTGSLDDWVALRRWHLATGAVFQIDPASCGGAVDAPRTSDATEIDCRGTLVTPIWEASGDGPFQVRITATVDSDGLIDRYSEGLTDSEAERYQAAMNRLIEWAASTYPEDSRRAFDQDGPRRDEIAGALVAGWADEFGASATAQQ